MKILVTGSTGQLGEAICRLGEKSGHVVIGYTREQFDITDREICSAILKKDKPDIIVNCSAYHVVPECEAHSDKAFAVNAVAQHSLAALAREIGAKIVYISTDKVFDGETHTPYREDDRTNPIQIYGISKRAGELVTEHYANDWYVIRTNGVYGGVQGSRSKNGNFVLYILREAQKVKELEISSDQYANFIYADDLATGILDLIRLKAKSGIYHLVNDGYASWADFAKEIVKQGGLHLEIKPVDRAGKYKGVPTPKYCILDISKVQAAGLQIAPWQGGIGRYLSYIRKHT